MEKFDIRKYKYLLATIFIFIIFVMLIANAYKYLPSNEEINNQKNYKNYELINQDSSINASENIGNNFDEYNTEEDGTEEEDVDDNAEYDTETEIFDRNTPFRELSEDEIEQ